MIKIEKDDRITELAKEAGWIVNDQGLKIGLKEFAELIIKECAKVADKKF